MCLYISGWPTSFETASELLHASSCTCVNSLQCHSKNCSSSTPSISSATAVKADAGPPRPPTAALETSRAAYAGRRARRGKNGFFDSGSGACAGRPVRRVRGRASATGGPWLQRRHGWMRRRGCGRVRRCGRLRGLRRSHRRGRRDRPPRCFRCGGGRR